MGNAGESNGPAEVDNDPYNGLRAGWEEVLRRLKRPVRQATFWVYLWLAVIGFGGLAIWIEWWRYWNQASDVVHSLDNLKLALATVFPAVVGASALQLVLLNDRMARNLGLLFLAVHGLLALYLLGFGRPSDSVGIILGIAGCMGAILVWWIASGLDELFQDRPGPDAAVGGDPTRRLNTRHSNIRT